MDIVVLIKQVPDTKNIKIDPETNTLIREGVESIINPFDMYALETALRLKDEFGGKVSVLSMGPPQAEEALRETISYGADEAVLLSHREFAGSDTLATARTLAAGIRKQGHMDLVICGKQAIDGDTAQVGPGVAQKLGIPHVAFVKRIERVDAGRIVLQRMMDDGYDLLEIKLPALITVVKEINEPRVPSLKGKMRAKTIRIPVWGPEDLDLTESEVGLKGSATWVTQIFAPKPRGRQIMLKGEVHEQVNQLLELLIQDKAISLH
jgi:electron transfer flavoprotein beta subunit